MTLIVHPLTADANNLPAYTADNFRRANNVWFSPSNMAIGSASSCISGVRNENDAPICTISGLTVTVKPHSGIIYPFAGGSPYTYYIADESVSIPNTTQSWKIAIEVTDPSVGYGSTPGATLKALVSTTPNSSINGLVLALVTQGVVNDIAPRLLSGTIIQVQTFDGLSQIATTDGQWALVKTTNTYYVRKNGAWVPYQRDYWRGDARRSDDTLNLNNGRTDLSMVKSDGNLNATISYDDGGARITGLPVGDYYITAQLYAQGFGQPTWINFGADAVQNTRFLVPSYNESSIWNAGYSGASLATIATIPDENSGFIISINTVWQGNAAPTMRIPIQVAALRL